jgi:chromosome segregation ATPase
MEKSRLFEQVQLRQAEFESSQTQLESLQGQTAELNYQLRESEDRIALLTEELTDARRDQHTRSSAGSSDADDAARILALTEAKYEAKLTELRGRVQAAEKERNDGEAAWSRKLDEKSREMDELRRTVELSTKVKEGREDLVAQARQETERVQEELRAHLTSMAELRHVAEQAAEAEVRRFATLHVACLDAKSRLTVGGGRRSPPIHRKDPRVREGSGGSKGPRGSIES